MSKECQVHDWKFSGLMTPAATASVVDGPWAKADTSAAGAPTLTTVGGYMVGTLEATSEVQNLCLYHGDILSFDIDDLQKFEIWIKASAAFPAGCTLVFGMASARNATPDSVAANAWFRLEANNTVLVETDDGVNDNDDKATGLTLSTTERKFEIDFCSGVLTRSPPSQSLGGKGHVLFSGENSQGLMVPIARGVAFNMENYAAGLQPIVQLQKTASVEVPSFSVRRIRITERMN